MDFELVQALDQTKKRLATTDEQGTGFSELAASVDAVLAHYRVEKPGDVAFTEDGVADRIDRTGPTGGEAKAQKEQVQAALIAFAERPTQEHARLAREALDTLHGTMTD